MAERRVCLVRAVNVGSTGQLPMPEWRAIAEELGASEVTTYIRSGNLLCVPPDGSAHDAAGAFDRALEKKVSERFGFFREVISRSRAELLDAVAAFPFGTTDPKFAYIVFLADEPAPDAIAAAFEIPTGDDAWRLRGRDLFVRYAAGAGRAHPGMVKVPKVLGVPGTARNLLTVNKLIELATD